MVVFISPNWVKLTVTVVKRLLRLKSVLVFTNKIIEIKLSRIDKNEEWAVVRTSDVVELLPTESAAVQLLDPKI